MLQSLAQYIEQRLATEGVATVNATRFAELAGRLLASGVVWREHSRPEAALYDDAMQCEQLLREWFACIGFVLVHDSDARLLRLYPPGEGGGDDGEDGVRRLRARLSRDFVAAVIALRFLYTEALTGRRPLVDERLAVSLEELSQAVVSLLAHKLPNAASERMVLLRELRKHRVLHFVEGDDAGDMQMGLAVLRPVMSFVSDEALEEALRLVGRKMPASSTASPVAESASEDGA
ncbi:DUF4194 domain-containing protein [Hydrogenophaga crocea]|uniref:DUF4194 domain-containing protein n=1 Tax=Hydrogenophaga crocea TaxID=2716225 RepID=A0A6G8II84_9BURK|nr:DUF4194 domain-containing protein [Hydrogenophaga crocea]QIM52745.1 DUF4194 domain-containing protein [Hydrogenophaga crocea]